MLVRSGDFYELNIITTVKVNAVEITSLRNLSVGICYFLNVTIKVVTNYESHSCWIVKVGFVTYRAERLYLSPMHIL